jgi:hypothetical protein
MFKELNMRTRLFWLVVGLALCFTLPAFSQSILIWDKDHNKTFSDPEGAGMVDATYGIKKALTENGYTFTTVTALPSNLNPYDIIFTILGV